MLKMDTGNLLTWQALKVYLPPGTELKSVWRPPFDQLTIIKKLAEKEGFRFKMNPTVSDPASWQPALEFIRSKGYKVAAPGHSMHQRGLAYDLVGPNLTIIYNAVKKAVSENRIRLVRDSKDNLIIETKNRVVHVEIETSFLDYAFVDV